MSTLSRVTLILLAVALPCELPAQQRTASDQGDRAHSGPALGVARVSVADGDVRIQRPSGDEFQARASMPLVAGDAILTGAHSRSEVQLDHGNFLRLNADSQVRMGDLGNKSFRVEVVRGLVSFSQLRGGEADVDVDTPLATVRVLKSGTFTVEFRETGQTDVIVRDGEVEVVAAGRTERLKKGMLTVRGKPNDSQVRLAKAEPKSDFDQWNDRRDKMLERGPRYEPWVYSPYYWDPYYAGFGYGYGFWGRPYYWGPRAGVVIVPRGGGHGRRH